LCEEENLINEEAIKSMEEAKKLEKLDFHFNKNNRLRKQKSSMRDCIKIALT